MKVKWISWNPWHGCTRISPGCKNCYVYTMDQLYGKDASIVFKTKAFQLPIALNRTGGFAIPSGCHIFTCGSSDFFMKRQTLGVKRLMISCACAQISIFSLSLSELTGFTLPCPATGGEGYDHVTIGCTCEDQQQADYRLPLFFDTPIRHRVIVRQPLIRAYSFAALSSIWKGTRSSRWWRIRSSS